MKQPSLALHWENSSHVPVDSLCHWYAIARLTRWRKAFLMAIVPHNLAPDSAWSWRICVISQAQFYLFSWPQPGLATIPGWWTVFWKYWLISQRKEWSSVYCKMISTSGPGCGVHISLWELFCSYWSNSNEFSGCGRPCKLSSLASTEVLLTHLVILRYTTLLAHSP